MTHERKNQGQGRGSSLATACKLYKKESANGRGYLMGRLGGLRVLIMPKKAEDAGEHTHVLLIGEATTQRESGEGSR